MDFLVMFNNTPQLAVFVELIFKVLFLPEAVTVAGTPTIGMDTLAPTWPSGCAWLFSCRCETANLFNPWPNDCPFTKSSGKLLRACKVTGD